MTARLLFVVKVALVFLIAGPPVGALVYILLIAAWIGHGDTGGAMLVFMFGAIFGMPLSYGLGALPAVLTGVAAAVWRMMRGTFGFVEAGLLGAGAGVVTALAGRIPAGDAELSAPNAFALLLLTCLAATLACWWLATRLVTGFRRAEPRLGF